MQKEKALEEKDVLIAGLTRALSELKQQLHSSALSPSSKPEMEVEAVKDVQQTVIPEQETTALEVIEKGANPARDVTPIGQQAEENISRPATPVTEVRASTGTERRSKSVLPRRVVSNTISRKDCLLARVSHGHLLPTTPALTSIMEDNLDQCSIHYSLCGQLGIMVLCDIHVECHR